MGADQEKGKSDRMLKLRERASVMAVALLAEQRDEAIRQVERFCTQRTPEGVRAQMRVEHEVRGATITIVERHSPWDERPGSDWSTQPVAQLRHDADAATWALYWPRHTGRWQRYENVPPAGDVAPLLSEIDADPDGVFWG